MATVKKKSNKKLIVIISLVLVAAIVASTCTVYAFKNKKPQVTLAEIGTADIFETVSATGTVSAGSTKEYKVDSIATVKEVFVEVGDEVKKGDRLATFDTSTLSKEVANLQNTYDTAKADYNASVAAQKTAKATANAIDAQIAVLQKQLDELPEYQPAPTTTRARTTTTTTEATTRETTTRQPLTTTTTEPVTYPPTMAGLVAAITDLVNTINGLAADIQTTNELVRIVFTIIVEEIDNGNLSADNIAAKVGKAVGDAINEGLIEFVDSGAAVEMIEAAVRSVNWAEVAGAIMNSNSVQGASLQLQITALTAQKEIYNAQASDSIPNAKKEIMTASKSALDVLKQSKSELEAGWVATFDGTITACDIAAGAQANVLSGGITLEDMDSMVVTISLNEYDIHKVRVGMKATITSAYGSYDGEVISKAPTATGGSTGSLLDSVGSMAGISGLSSLTATGAGVEVKVRVNSPDELIIIGFDVDVEVQVGSYTGVTVVPIESIVLEKEGTFVYLYDEEENTVSKTKIETGAVSDSYYEVKSGISIGDSIVSTPSSDYKEDTFAVKVAK